MRIILVPPVSGFDPAASTRSVTGQAWLPALTYSSSAVAESGSIELLELGRSYPARIELRRPLSGGFFGQPRNVALADAALGQGASQTGLGQQRLETLRQAFGG